MVLKIDGNYIHHSLAVALSIDSLFWLFPLISVFTNVDYRFHFCLSCCLSCLSHFTHNNLVYEPLARYVKVRIAHALGMPGPFSPPSRFCDPDMHHVTYVTHVPWCMPGSLFSGFLWSQWQGKRSRHSRRMHNPRFCVSAKRPMPNGVGLWTKGPLSLVSSWGHSVYPLGGGSGLYGNTQLESDYTILV